MTLNEMALSQGVVDALEKFAAGQMFAASAPPKPPVAASPMSAVSAQKPPTAVGGSTGMPTAPMGMPAAAVPSAVPAMGGASSPVLGTGTPAAAPASVLAGRTSEQLAGGTIATGGGGR